MSKHQYRIAVLLPTRARTDALSRSLFSLVDHASDLSQIQFIVGIDEDDDVGINHFVEKIQPKFDELDINYTALSFKPLGYHGLNTYYNSMVKQVDADWIFVWCDDAIMTTKGWDQVIDSYTGQFKILKVHTHNEHPYSIFPIVPVEYYQTLGFLSRHQLIDAEISQIAYLLNLIQIVDIDVTHDRADLTGNNNDANANAEKKQYLEGNPNDPRDFHHVNNFGVKRWQDAEVISGYMKTVNLDTAWWESVKAGKTNPWLKMLENDPNGQTGILQTVQDPITGQQKMVPVSHDK